MKSKNILIYLVSIIPFASCEQFLEVDLPGQEPRMVLNALLEPADTLKVFLTKSRGVLEGREYDEFELVKNAEVYLKDENGQIFPMGYIDRSRPYEQNAFYYLSGQEFVGDQTYEIVAEHAGFPTISSEQKLPGKIQINSIELVDLGPRPDFESENEFEVTVKFDDPPGRNFYEISGRIFGRDIFVSEGDTSLFFYSSDLYPKPVNPVYQKDHLIRQVILFDDTLLGGSSEIVFRTSIRRNMDMEVTINFSHVSASYFRFYDTADLQQYNRGDFLSQPVLVYNNVTNGLGIFKARNTDQRVIKIRVGD